KGLLRFFAGLRGEKVASFRSSRGPLSRAEGSPGKRIQTRPPPPRPRTRLLSFERIADLGISHHPGPRKIRGIIRGYLRELFQALTKLEDEDEHENEAVARMNIDNYFSKFATKRPNGAFCNIFGGYRHSAPDYFRLRFKSPGHGFT